MHQEAERQLVWQAAASTATCSASAKARGRHAPSARRKPAVRDRLLLAGSGCTRASAVRRVNANDKFQARQSEALEPTAVIAGNDGDTTKPTFRDTRRHSSKPISSLRTDVRSDVPTQPTEIHD